MATNTCLSQQKYFEQNEYHAIAICVVNFPLCITALVGNSAILIAIWKTPSLHSPANILLANLAVSDFAVGLIAQPLLISFLLVGMYGYLDIYIINCKAFNYVAYFLCGVSFTTITAIGFDRFLALRLHLRYNSVVTTIRVNLAIFCIWMWAGFCSLLWLWKSENATILATMMFVLLLLNFTIYRKIHSVVRRHHRQIQQQQTEGNYGNNFKEKRLRKSAVSTFLVFVLLVCCYAPQMAVLTTTWVPFTVYYTTVTIVLLNSSLNPLLYCWRVHEIRTAIKQLFHG